MVKGKFYIRYYDEQNLDPGKNAIAGKPLEISEEVFNLLNSEVDPEFSEGRRKDRWHYFDDYSPIQIKRH